MLPIIAYILLGTIAAYALCTIDAAQSKYISEVWKGSEMGENNPEQVPRMQLSQSALYYTE